MAEEKLSKREKKILAASKKYAGKKGFKLNPNEKILFAVIKGLAKNEEKHGYRFCPCRALTGNIQEDVKNICPCVFHLDEIKKDGHCRCTLFYGALEKK